MADGTAESEVRPELIVLDCEPDSGQRIMQRSVEFGRSLSLVDLALDQRNEAVVEVEDGVNVRVGRPFGQECSSLLDLDLLGFVFAVDPLHLFERQVSNRTVLVDELPVLGEMPQACGVKIGQ
jgi:hypothetical protein